MRGKSVILPGAVSRTSAPKERRSKACREKSAEVMVPSGMVLGKDRNQSREASDAVDDQEIAEESEKEPDRSDQINVKGR